MGPSFANPTNRGSTPFPFRRFRDEDSVMCPLEFGHYQLSKLSALDNVPDPCGTRTRLSQSPMLVRFFERAGNQLWSLGADRPPPTSESVRAQSLSLQLRAMILYTVSFLATGDYISQEAFLITGVCFVAEEYR